MLATIVRGAWGGILLLDPGLPLRLGGGSDSAGVREATRILGARHVIEALVLVRGRDVRVRRWIAGVDAVHALSMVGVAAVNARLRRDALLSAASATGLAAIALSSA